jgi:hypothetical protein
MVFVRIGTDYKLEFAGYIESLEKLSPKRLTGCPFVTFGRRVQNFHYIADSELVDVHDVLS